MAGTPEIVLDELPELYHELERLHLVPLWEIAPRRLPREPQPHAILFSVQDTPILQALGLYREQAHEMNNGHQAIRREFHP